MTYTVTVAFDDENRRYITVDTDVPGLTVETDTFEEFVEVAMDLIPHLLGTEAVRAGAEIVFKMVKMAKAADLLAA
jgi:hypothetical protein